MPKILRSPQVRNPNSDPSSICGAASSISSSMGSSFLNCCSPNVIPAPARADLQQTSSSTSAGGTTAAMVIGHWRRSCAWSGMGSARGAGGGGVRLSYQAPCPRTPPPCLDRSQAARHRRGATHLWPRYLRRATAQAFRVYPRAYPEQFRYQRRDDSLREWI